jgi:hypothetical protein
LLADEIRGWHSILEIGGWWTLCVGVSIVCSEAFAKLHRSGWRKSAYLVPAAVGAIFLILTIREARPDTPATIKDLATAPLQPLGIIGILALALLISKIRRRSYRG